MSEERNFALLEKEIAWLEAENESLRKRIAEREHDIVSSLIKNGVVGKDMIYPSWIVNRAVELARELSLNPGKDFSGNVFSQELSEMQEEILKQIKRELEEKK